MNIFVAVQTDDFCHASEYNELRKQPGCGAIVTFTGLVRDLASTELYAMTLEHYPGMTETALQQIARQASLRWHLGAAYPGSVDAAVRNWRAGLALSAHAPIIGASLGSSLSSA